MTAVTLVRFCADEVSPDIHTYVVMRSAEVAAILAGGYDHGTAETLPWNLLPGIRELAAAKISSEPGLAVMILGTTEGTEWTTWHLPVAAPAVPA